MEVISLCFCNILLIRSKLLGPAHREEIPPWHECQKWGLLGPFHFISFIHSFEVFIFERETHSASEGGTERDTESEAGSRL